MANEEQLAIIQQGVEAWNKWREANQDVEVDLSGANLSGDNLSGADLAEAHLTDVALVAANLSGANLAEANLSGANLTGANLAKANLAGTDISRVYLFRATLTEATLTGANISEAALFKADLIQADLTEANLGKADLSGADLSGAILTLANLTGANLSMATLKGTNLTEADLPRADLPQANLSGANLSRANLFQANLNMANLHKANLTGANLTAANINVANLHGAILTGADLTCTNIVQTDFTEATLNGCRIYGISAWDVNLMHVTKQKDLIITPHGQPEVTVDNLEVAQFIYLILNNAKLKGVIDTLTSKLVLILGRFGPRKPILEAIKEELRSHDLLPVIFDFDPPQHQRLTDTVTTLARLALFVIIDISDPSCAPAETQVVLPELPTVPVQLIWQKGTPTWWMVRDFSPGLYPSLIAHGGDPAFLYDDRDHIVRHVGDIVARAQERATMLRDMIHDGSAAWDALVKRSAVAGKSTP